MYGKEIKWVTNAENESTPPTFPPNAQLTELVEKVQRYN